MTKGESAIRNPRSAVIWLFFAAAIIVVFFAGLTVPLVGPDEPRYAQVAREMFERGDWITPTLGGYNWFEKPALLYWLEIISFNLFGVSEFAARFGSALFGVGTVLILWILGRQIDSFATNAEQRSTNEFANWLALVAGTTIGLIAFAHGASFDIILTFPITAAMVSYFVYEQRGRIGWLFSFYFFIGLALLAKGLIGIVFPFAIVTFYHLLSWSLPSRTVIPSVIWGTIVAAAVASAWYVPMYLRHGYEFIDQFLIQHHFQRYTSNKYLHPQPFHFFFWVLPLMTIPWLPFFFVSLWKILKKFIRRFTSEETSDATPQQKLATFAFAWMAVPVVFFSFSGSKLPGYILPALPAAIILSAGIIYDFARSSRVRENLVRLIAATTLARVLISILFFLPGFAETDSVKSLFAAARARGLEGIPVMTMHRMSHNAEFYTSGPLLRDAEGKQERLTGPREVVAEMRKAGSSRALVMIPPEYLHHLTQSDQVQTEILQSNEEWALTLVTIK
jgi:4-amino-4-deoxy-L-arabinose transferase-like glycosyltransferase